MKQINRLNGLNNSTIKQHVHENWIKNQYFQKSPAIRCGTFSHRSCLSVALLFRRQKFLERLQKLEEEQQQELAELEEEQKYAFFCGRNCFFWSLFVCFFFFSG